MMRKQMGLDQYVYMTSQNISEKVDFSKHLDDVELFWWGRDESDLKNWLSILYFERGGQGTSCIGGKHFNGNTLLLTADDIAKIEENSIIDEPKNFYSKALSLISEGKQIYYYCTW